MASRLKIAVLICYFVLSGSTVLSQPPEAPAGASDKGAIDRGTKDRSIELDRIKRDANKPDARGQEAPSQSAAKFAEIKEDFEGLQRRQDGILKAYTTGKQVDHEKIAANSEQMNKHAVRLETNLFPTVETKKGKKKPNDEKGADTPTMILPSDLKSLIIEQDNTLASFVSNPMFTNPQVANAADTTKAHADLKKLILLTAALRTEAQKRPPLK